ncbi:hypothetical protein ONZ45_g12720 [Pleurotus djamor]|nr:hypothetical protein ONZ45_g12720 [Pleurotus djamor]
MLVDNSPSYAAPYDLSDFFHTDFLSSPAPTNNNASSSTAMKTESTEGSHPSSPESSHSPASALNTPPQPQLPTSFPDILEPMILGFFSFIDEEGKAPGSSADTGSSFDLYSSYALGMGMPMDFNSMGLDLHNIGMDLDLTVPIDPTLVSTPGSGPVGDPSQQVTSGAQVSSSVLSPESGIDPQLVGTPVSQSHDGDDECDSEEHGEDGGVDQDEEDAMVEDVSEGAESRLRPARKASKASSKSKQSTQQQLPRVTLTITPVKVGGHGKARRGTVQSGGVKKNSVASSSSSLLASALSAPPPRTQVVEKENTSLPTSNAVPRTSTPGASTSASVPSASGKAKRSASGKEKASGKDRNIDRGERPLTLPEKLAQLKSSSTPVVARNLGLGDWISGAQDADINAADQVDRLYSFSNSQSTSPRATSIHENDDDEKDDDIPADWRPPPEVFQKMSSKEKRQLRNKISARNFQYITTLEGDIAERDRLLQAIRAQLGETQSENVALRQEIDALKKALLSGRGSESGVILNLPPPAPLPAQSAAEKLAAAASAPSTSLLTPNTQKDLPSSPRVGGKRSGFWGGLSPLGGGITPVHAAIVPEWGSILGQGVFGTSGHSSDSSSASSSPGPTTDYGSDEEPAVHINDHKELENINPRLNGSVREAQEDGYGIGGAMPNGFGGVGAGSLDGFADMNPFTMKTLDMYRMQLWGRMAAQYHHHQHQQAASPNMPKQQQQQHLSGLAGSLRPAFFAPSSKANAPAASGPPPPYTPYAAGTVGAGPLSALLMGKSAASFKSSSYSTTKKDIKVEEKEATLQQYAQFQRDRENQQRDAVVAAIATQTLLKRLGSAFWDAFSGHASASSAPSSSGGVPPRPFTAKWDAEKVRKVLEGKAVLKVVDVEPTPQVVKREAPREVKREVKDKCGHGPAAECLSQMLGSLTLSSTSGRSN